jgi:tripartite-type tricarboxylate transporter receptor subunit TctC
MDKGRGRPTHKAAKAGVKKRPREEKMFRVLTVLAIWLGAAVSAQAQEKAPFFEGKTITIVTSTGSGGGYDVMARLLTRHMPRHIPGNPVMIVQNMPGGGNVIATNHMYTVAPKDGTVIATIHNAIPLHQVLDGRGVRYDVSKFNWLGSTGSDNEVIFSWHTSGVKDIDDAKKKEVIMGGTGAGSGVVIIPAAMNSLLGTKFKMVMGYKSSEDLNLALQREEIQSRAFSLGSILTGRADWLAEKKINLLAQVGEHRAHEIPDVPLITELAKNDEDKQILKLISSPPGLGKPFMAPPGLPEDRLAILRKAFDETMKDKAFLAEAEKLKMEIEPMSAEEVTQIVKDVVTAPPDVVAKARAMMSAGDK